MMKKMSKLSTLATISLAGAMFVGASVVAPSQAKAEAVTATILAGTALGLTLLHDPWPIEAVVAASPIGWLSHYGSHHYGHPHGYYGAYDHYVHVGVPRHSHAGVVVRDGACSDHSHGVAAK